VHQQGGSVSAQSVGNESSEVDERLSALLTNAAAVRAIAGAVENTLGPKGLDTMLVDRSGDIVVTNAGVIILDRMEVTHPAARMLINIARHQHEEVGDGTTTATIMAGTLVNEGLNYVIRGVPVSRVIEGIKRGIAAAIAHLEKVAIRVESLDDPLVARVTSIAGRNEERIASCIVELAGIIGTTRLVDPLFKLSDHIMAEIGAGYQVYPGLIIRNRRCNEQMPRLVTRAKVLVLEDHLRPEELSDSALKSDAGFAQFLAYQEAFRKNMAMLLSMGIRLVAVEGGLDEYSEDLFTRAGILAISRLHGDDLKALAEYTGARALKRSALGWDEAELSPFLGYAEEAGEDEKLGHIRIRGGKGEALATMLLGAATEEVVGEKERIARDAASALQAALKGGVVPGGGAFEISLIPRMREMRATLHGMTAYGIDCVIEALKRPMAQIIANAGYNPLEKIEEVLSHSLKEEGEWGVDCDTGGIIDMKKEYIIDPALVKKHALKAAGEVAEAILRINTIVKMKDRGTGRFSGQVS
jgi:archaeal chaperonin